MPIRNKVDDDLGLIYTECVGKMMLDDYFGYVRSIWSDQRCYGYNELFDLTQADWSEFDFESLTAIASNAASLQSIDPQSKVAFVVHDGKQREIIKLYQNLKTQQTAPSRQLASFMQRKDAMLWLVE